MTGQNPEQVPSTIAGATRLTALQRSIEELDRELDELTRGVPTPRRDVAVDASSLAHIEDLLDALGSAVAPVDLTWSAAPVPFEAHVAEPTPAASASPVVDSPAMAAAVSIEPAQQVDVVMDVAVGDDTIFGESVAIDATSTVVAAAESEPAILSFAPAAEPQAAETPLVALDEPREEDIPRRFLDFAEPAAQGDALATVVDLPDLDVEPPPASPSALETLIAAPEGVAPPSAQSSLPQLDEPLFLSEPPALLVADLALDAAPEVPAATADAPAPELGAAVESMLIDEDEVVVEAAASTPPVAAASASSPPAAEAQVVVDTDDVLVMDPPAAATGTLLGLAPAVHPSSRAPGGPSDGDLGEIVFNLEPELEVAKPTTAAPRAVIVSTPPQRPRDSAVGPSGSKLPPRARDSLDNLELDLSELMPGEARPPSLRPPPLLRQPPPPPQQRSAPPPVPRAPKSRAEVEEIVELDEQEVEVLRASSRPPPAGESKAPPPVPQRPGGQK
ncbi:MAG: hypothetical protein U0324_08075 [Polyangiales bacterium]